jgi:hypothetical protein
VKLWHLFPRLTAGAFILNSGLDKRGADPDTAAGMHGMASTAYPFLADQDPQRFVSALSTGEIALGSALVAPVVPTTAIAAPLTAFATGLVGLYMRVPGMRQEGSIKPTPDGLTIAKDVWLLGIGLALLTDVLSRSD